MTIRLLCAYSIYPVNAIVTLDTGTEAGLVAAKRASTNTAGGTVYVPPVQPNQIRAANLVIDPAGNVLGLAGPNNSIIAIGGSTATKPGQPARPVLTAMAGAVSLAWTPGAAGSTATTSNIWTDVNGKVTQLTTNPQIITAPAGTPYTGTVTTLNAQGAGPASVQADTVTPTAAPATLRTFETFDVNGNNTNTFNRVAVAELGRTSLIIRSPAGNTAQIALGYRDADNLNNPNPDFSAPILINPGEEMFSDNDQLQYFARQNAATAVSGQYVEIEKVITL
ncbi:hypothetical protein ASF04_23895 [Duganella sp. Leaf61]|uniref:hypothetical protein n=1 Tax=Duganella sp. Leaf61 TaxID=1736227 RepID=UPI0006F1F1B6|nr:hypothetical protein [Duganella sp. Leaf61]KQN77814.1 hypothetical protein ASF04_23895 [Duganella sp. Leaf61]